jgi:hypothetical protein
MEDPAYWKFRPAGKPYFLLRPDTQNLEPSKHAYPNPGAGPIMSAMASRETTWTARIGGSARRPRLCVAATGGGSVLQDAACIRAGRYPPTHPWRRGGDLGRWPSGTGMLAWVAGCVPRWAERRQRFPGAGRSAPLDVITSCGRHRIPPNRASVAWRPPLPIGRDGLDGRGWLSARRTSARGCLCRA